MLLIEKQIIKTAVKNALNEDFGRLGDVTSALTIDAGTQISASLVAREKGVLAGAELVREVYKQIDDKIIIDFIINDGGKIESGKVIANIVGDARSILAGERVALNFLCHMSGIASTTKQFVDKIKGSNAKICCTRKTLPGLRVFQKYAVRVAGGYNHRYGLDDAILIKDNHIASAGGIKEAVLKAKAGVSHMMKIEVEVDNLEQLSELIKLGADIVLLDNMDASKLEKAVRMVKESGSKMLCEASGGINLENIEEISKTSVDYISIGGLTHSAKYLDIGIDILGTNTDQKII